MPRADFGDDAPTPSDARAGDHPATLDAREMRASPLRHRSDRENHTFGGWHNDCASCVHMVTFPRFSLRGWEKVCHMAMRNVYVSRRYLRPVIAGLLLCGLSGFALGQALGHRSVPPTTPHVVHASGALGTVTPTISPTPTLSTPAANTTTAAADSPAQLLSAPVAAHPGTSHHDDAGGHGHGEHHGPNGGHPGHGKGGHSKGARGGD